jgi:hypothetical protein
MSPPDRVGSKSKWIVKQLARECAVTEPEAERALLELIARGHIRIVPGAGPKGADGFEGIIKSPAGRR